MRAKASRERKGRWKLGLLLLGASPIFLNSCASYEGGPGQSGWGQTGSAPFTPVGDGSFIGGGTGDSSLAASPEYFRKPSAPRPGQATTWGASISSRMTYTNFSRASSKPAGGVATIWYNDKKGVDAMTHKNYHTSSGRERSAGGLVEWGMKSGLGTMRNYHWDGKRFVVGRNGSKYSISVKNNARSRLEVVLSVDGLDVVDGKSASIKKRGYIIWPGQTVEIKGWRSSEREVASFVFSSVSASYANLKHGKTRNVGVVGMAVFTEKGIDPWSGNPEDANKRFAASPFAEAPMQRAR